MAAKKKRKKAAKKGAKKVVRKRKQGREEALGFSHRTNESRPSGRLSCFWLPRVTLRRIKNGGRAVSSCRRACQL